MTNSEISSDTTSTQPAGSIRRPRGQRAIILVSVLGALVVGAGGATLAARNRQPTILALTPIPIASLKDWTAVAVKGQVSDVFGNKFVVQDNSGRALVDTGPDGDRGTLVAPSEPVTIQGRFDHGFIHAIAITHGDGRTVVVGPPGPCPRRGPPAPDAREPGRGSDRPPAPQG